MSGLRVLQYLYTTVVVRPYLVLRTTVVVRSSFWLFLVYYGIFSFELRQAGEVQYALSRSALATADLDTLTKWKSGYN